MTADTASERRASWHSSGGVSIIIVRSIWGDFKRGDGEQPRKGEATKGWDRADRQLLPSIISCESEGWRRGEDEARSDSFVRLCHTLGESWLSFFELGDFLGGRVGVVLEVRVGVEGLGDDILAPGRGDLDFFGDDPALRRHAAQQQIPRQDGHFQLPVGP